VTSVGGLGEISSGYAPTEAAVNIKGGDLQAVKNPFISSIHKQYFKRRKQYLEPINQYNTISTVQVCLWETLNKLFTNLKKYLFANVMSDEW
jgi:hypothetical protein